MNREKALIHLARSRDKTENYRARIYACLRAILEDDILSADGDNGKDIAECDQLRKTSSKVTESHFGGDRSDLLGDLCDAESIHEPETVHFQGRPNPPQLDGSVQESTHTPEEVVEALGFVDLNFSAAAWPPVLAWAVRELAWALKHACADNPWIRGTMLERRWDDADDLARAITEDTNGTT